MLRSFIFGLALALPLPLLAQFPVSATVRKGHLFRQTGLSAPVTTGGGGDSNSASTLTMTGTGASDAPIALPWFFVAAVDPSASGPSSFTAPGGAPVSLPSAFTVTYASQAADDAAYPDGNYVLQFNGQSRTVTLAGDAYPNAPVATLGITYQQPPKGSSTSPTQPSPPTMASGILTMDPTAATTISTDFTTNYTPGRAYMEIRLIDPAGAMHSINSAPGYAQNHLTLTLPANSLPAGAGTLMLYLFNYGNLDQASVPGFAVGASYAAETQIPVQIGFNTGLTITTQPQSQTVTAGSNVTLSVAATGAIVTHYQWYLNGSPVGPSTATYTIQNISTAQAGDYTVTAYSAGTTSVTSAAATLAVNPATSQGGTNNNNNGGNNNGGTNGNAVKAPQFVPGPGSQLVQPGSSVVFNSSILSSVPVTYQWYFNGTPVTNATQAELAIFNAGIDDLGSYTCVATNSAGSTTSSPATLTFLSATAPQGRLVNLSVLTSLAPAGGLTAGFATGGAGVQGALKLLIRGDGPSLAAFGVAGVLPDPKLTLFDGAGKAIASNDNWGTDPNVAATIPNTGAYPFTDPASLDAAIALAPANGTYSVQVTGKGNDAGAVLAEIYDATPASVLGNNAQAAVTPRLINLSALTSLPAGGTLSVGFVVANVRTVMIRGIGPGLRPFGVGDPIPDIHLALLGSPAGTVQTLHSSNGWAGDPQMATAAARVGAFALGDPLGKDGVILVTLQHGSYTAQVSSVSGVAGSALVEVYEVP